MAAVLGGDSMRECSCVVYGLWFYTPDIVGNEALTAYDHCRQITDRIAIAIVDPVPDGVYAFTPSGEHLLADLDVSELQQVERDLKSVSSRNC